MTEACSIEREELKPCALCGKGLIATGLPIVWRFRAERIVIDLTETRRAAGLEMMVNDHDLDALIARGDGGGQA